MDAKLYELITVIIRQVALIYGTWLIATGHADQSMLQPVIGVLLNWMAYARFINPAIPADPVVVTDPTANT